MFCSVYCTVPCCVLYCTVLYCTCVRCSVLYIMFCIMFTVMYNLVFCILYPAQYCLHVICVLYCATTLCSVSVLYYLMFSVLFSWYKFSTFMAEFILDSMPLKSEIFVSTFKIKIRFDCYHRFKFDQVINISD